ncbi:restriction endonuclease subunit S [Salipiger marinus]|uniref:restriction endonuclease subunit S n=1 Tax=Salipiger marinus TaxID=555512 RepID=UPI004059921C
MSQLQEVDLVEIARPKQWPTLSRRELKPEGFPVYGANGIIGFADQYTHEEPTIIIGCRGSCGTLHITQPKSYVTGNAMALDQMRSDLVDQRYIFHFLARRGFNDVISGSSQPQITGKGLARIKVPLLPLLEQRRISDLLDKADSIRRKRTSIVAKVDELIKSEFVKRFGTPLNNSKGLPVAPIKSFGEVVTGNTPPRKNPENYGDEIEWIKSDNINTPNHFLTVAQERLSLAGKRIGRTAPSGSTLVTCIAGSPRVIGNAALADREVAFNQQINAVIPGSNTDPYFLYCQFLVAKSLVQASSTNSMKGMVSKGKFQEIEFIRPATEDQVRFGVFFSRVHNLSRSLDTDLSASEELFRSLSQRAFRGEL